MSSRLTIVDNGWSRLFVNAKALAGTSIECGIFEDSPPYPDGTPVILVAAVNEFGSPEKNIPARPWKTSTEEDPQVQKTLQILTDRVVTQVLEGKLTVRAAANALGEFFTSEQKLRLAEGPWVPNAPATVKRKGRNTPLQDTYHLLSSISYRVFQ